MKKITEYIQPLLALYKIEIVFISLAFSILIGSLITIVKAYNIPVKGHEQVGTVPPPSEAISTKYSVEISGAVTKPGVYQIESNKRLNDLIILAGGLSANADKEYVARNFNLATLLTDQEKVYIPSQLDIKAGLFSENNIPIQNGPNNSNDQATADSQSQSSTLVNINTASLDELDTLPGVGKTISEKIVQNRPYSSLDELVDKKIVGKSVYDQIKSMIKL